MANIQKYQCHDCTFIGVPAKPEHDAPRWAWPSFWASVGTFLGALVASGVSQTSGNEGISTALSVLAFIAFLYAVVFIPIRLLIRAKHFIMDKDYCPRCGSTNLTKFYTDAERSALELKNKMFELERRERETKVKQVRSLKQDLNVLPKESVQNVTSGLPVTGVAKTIDP